MKHARTKLIVAALVLLAAVSYLAVAGIKKGWVYHMPVEAYVVDAQFHDQRVRLAGRVADENLTVNPGLMTASFTIEGQGAQLPVAYRGVIPDLFKGGCDVVVEGRQDAQGVFQADVMMTKCASKYDADSGSGHPGGPRPNDRASAESKS